MSNLIVNQRGETARAVAVSGGGAVLQISVRADATMGQHSGCDANLYLGRREATALLCALGDALGVSVEVTPITRAFPLAVLPLLAVSEEKVSVDSARAHDPDHDLALGWDDRVSVSVVYPSPADTPDVYDHRRRFTVEQSQIGKRDWWVKEREGNWNAAGPYDTFAAAYHEMRKRNEPEERRDTHTSSNLGHG